MFYEVNNRNQPQISQQQINHDAIIDNRPQIGNIIQNKDVLMALAKIQIGDILTGQITQEGQQMLLKLTTGLKLAAQLDINVTPDKILDFLVTGKHDNKLELEPLLTNRMPQGVKIEDSIIKEMQLPNNADMKDLVGQWMDKQLPLIKNQLVQTYQFVKNYDMPTELMTNLKSNDVTLNNQEMELVSQFKENGLENLTSTMENVFKGLNQQESVELTTQLSQHLSKEELKDILTSTSLAKSNTSQLSKKEFNALLDQVFDTTDDKIQSNFLRNIFSNLAKTSLINVGKEIIKNYMAVKKGDEEPFVKGMKKDDDDVSLKEMKKMEESPKRLKEITDDLKIFAKEKDTQQSLQKLDQTSQVLQKYQQEGQYYCFPLQIKDQDASGELYFFKPKKKKGDKESGMYVVLALDMPSLKHIEVHLKEQTDKIGLKIKVANDDILKLIEAHKERLQTLLEDSIPLGNIIIERLEVPIAKKVQESRHEGLNRLDFKV